MACHKSSKALISYFLFRLKALGKSITNKSIQHDRNIDYSSKTAVETAQNSKNYVAEKI
jgi:hypothetical protein